MRDTTALAAANHQRSVTAAELNVAAVREALSRLGDSAPPHLAAAGRLRLDHPTATLAELAQMAQPTLTKDTVAGRLRRLLIHARRTVAAS